MLHKIIFSWLLWVLFPLYKPYLTYRVQLQSVLCYTKCHTNTNGPFWAFCVRYECHCFYTGHVSTAAFICRCASHMESGKYIHKLSNILYNTHICTYITFKILFTSEYPVWTQNIYTLYIITADWHPLFEIYVKKIKSIIAKQNSCHDAMRKRFYIAKSRLFSLSIFVCGNGSGKINKIFVLLNLHIHIFIMCVVDDAVWCCIFISKFTSVLDRVAHGKPSRILINDMKYIFFLNRKL